MAITGLTLPSTNAAAQRPNVGEAVDVTVELFKRLGVVSDEQSLRESLSGDYERLVAANLGNGRLYPELPAVITFTQLMVVANRLAASEPGYGHVLYQEPSQIPGIEKGSVIETETSDKATSFTARLALYAEDSAYDPLLHFTGLPYDDTCAKSEELTQVKALEEKQVAFTEKHTGASLRAADHHDFLVWYSMDLIRGLPKQEIVLADSSMRIPALKYHSAHGDSVIGTVRSSGGQAVLDWLGGLALPWDGVSISAGLEV